MNVFRMPFSLAHCTLACGLAIGMLGPAALQAQNADQAIAHHVQVGEFAPAMALARAQQGPARDRALKQIAAGQARAGMRRAAFDTVAGIRGNRTFNQSLREVAGRPIGDGFFGRGGGNEPDFEELMDLIRDTIAPDSWQDTGGPGSIASFKGGVRVDTAGLVHSLLKGDHAGFLSAVRRRAGTVGWNADVRRNSLLRKVSLTRLERAVQLKLAAGKPLDEDMLVLAGLTKIQYVMVYPDSGDIVLAGPAGDWRADREGRLVGVESDRPVLRLDDFVVILRHMTQNSGKPFGCSITPLKENLARTQQFLNKSKGKRLPAGKRAKDKWMADLRDQLGLQAVEFYGVDPRTRVARVMFEADYRMKLMGIGLERGTHKTPSYLSRVKPGQAMNVLRWWFTLNYDSILTSPSRDAFQLRGQGVKVLSEKEMLDAQGNRTHTGKSDPLAAEFAKNFTDHFQDLAAKYPIYAELRNVFDLALVCSLMETEDLPGQVGWQMGCFGDAQAYPVNMGHAPKMVPSVMNHRNFSRGQFVVAVSGGVRVDPQSLTARSAIKTDRAGALGSRRSLLKPRNESRINWWWD